MLICLLVTSSGIAEMGYILSLDKETAKFWAHISFIRYLFYPLALHFIIIFCQRKRWLRHFSTYVFLYVPPITFMIVDLINSQKEFVATPKTAVFGFNGNFLGILSSVWSLGLCIFMLYISYRYYKSSMNYTKKSQAKLLTAGFGFLILFSLFSDYILPDLGISVPIISSFSLSFVVFIILPAISRPNLFSITVKSAADKIVTTMSDLMFIIDSNGEIIDVNPAACHALEYSKSELIGMKTDRLVPYGLDFEKITSQLSRSKEYMQWEFLTKSQKRLYISCSLTKFSNQRNGVKSYVFIGRNMTDMRESARKIRERENRYRMLFNSGNDMVLVFAYDGLRPGRLLEVNDRACEELGYTREELYRMSVFELFNPQMDITKEIYLNRIGNVHNMICEVEFITRKGQSIPFESNSRLFEMDGEKIVMMISRDLTERNMTQEMLAVMETAIDTSINAIFFTDIDGNVNWVNDAFLEMFGFEADEIMKSTALSVFFEESNRMLVEIKKFGRFSGEVHSETSKGNQLVLHLGASSFHHQSGSRIGIMGSCIDITDRVDTEKELERSRRSYMNLVEKANMGIIIEDQNDEIIYYNDMFLEIFGFDFDDIQNLSLQDVIDEESKTVFRNVKKQLENSSKSSRIDLKAKRKDKKAIYIVVDAVPTEEHNENIRYYIWDETEKYMMEKELLRVQKLESLGLLAGGIAHDFNNVLTGILGNISLARLSLKKGSKEYKLLIESELATVRARDLTQQLLTFSRGGMPVRETSSIENILRDTVEFIIRGKNIKAFFDIDDNLLAADVDRGQFSQVLNNIVINAIHAMPDGGQITINAQNHHLNDNNTVPLESGDYIKIDIIDNGTGISQENINKIFDPYFTTRDKGTGLGLATSYSIIKNHEGHITVKSKLSVGSCFTIYIPATKNLPKETNTDIPEAEIEVVAGKKILVMDDEEIIRDIAEGMLEHFGYKVELANNGQNAIKKYTEAMKKNKPFDAVIFDLTVPGAMGGKEAIEKLKQIDENITAIVSSGYSNDQIMSNYEEYGFVDVVVKPYEAEKLLSTLYRVLSMKENIAA